jgi:hypothetical protein
MREAGLEKLSDFLYRIGRKDMSDMIVRFEKVNHLSNIRVDEYIYQTLTSSTLEQDDIAALTGSLNPESGLRGETRRVVSALLSSWAECPKCGSFLAGILRPVNETRYAFSMCCIENHANNIDESDVICLSVELHQS